MLYTDNELLEQRNEIKGILYNIHNYILDMYKSNNCDYVYVDKDVEGLDYTRMCFGNIFFELYNVKYLTEVGFGSFAFKKDTDETNYQISFAILDDSIDLNDKKQILKLYLKVLEDHYSAVFHELVHYKDAESGYIMEDMTSNSKNKTDYINNKMEYHAYLQELLLLAEDDMALNNWNKMNMLQRLNLKNKYIENREKERKDKNDIYIYYFTKEHYNEMIEHVENLFAKHMLDKN